MRGAERPDRDLRPPGQLRRVPARPRIAFFDYPDVFEDFYPHYGVDQRSFATTWAATANHAFVRLLQQETADVTWYTLSLDPELAEARHEATGARVRVLRSSAAHRALWRAFYLSENSWRWERAYPAFAVLASYLAPLSRELIAALRRDRPDLIFSQDYGSGRFDVLLALARMLRVPLVAYHTGSVAERYVGRAAKRMTIRAADLLLASSEAEQQMLIRRFGVSPDRVRVVLTPIDLGIFRPGDRRSGRRTVLFVGRLEDPVKRVSVLIRSFAEIASAHPDADLVIAGSGPDEAGAPRAGGRPRAGSRAVHRLGFWQGGAGRPPFGSSLPCSAVGERGLPDRRGRGTGVRHPGGGERGGRNPGRRQARQNRLARRAERRRRAQSGRSTRRSRRTTSRSGERHAVWRKSVLRRRSSRRQLRELLPL